jgi:hypothetical protein
MAPERRVKLAAVGLVAAAAGTALAVGGRPTGAAEERVARASKEVEDVFVAAANRGDYATVCRLYSRHYLKGSQESCRALYRWGESLYGPYDYRIVRRRRTALGRRHVDLTVRHHASYIELAHEQPGWRIVAGGW